jgi:hypothetical protein
VVTCVNGLGVGTTLRVMCFPALSGGVAPTEGSSLCGKHFASEILSLVFLVGKELREIEPASAQHHVD